LTENNFTATKLYFPKIHPNTGIPRASTGLKIHLGEAGCQDVK
jgi:hypothetical protein